MSEERLPGLVIDIEARINKLEQGLRKASDRQKRAAAEMELRAKQSAEKIAGSYSRIGEGAAAGFGRLNQVFQQNSWRIGGAAGQFGDLATQIGGGTSALRAFGMQAGQIGGYFGPMGMAVGAAAAAIIPLASAFLNAGDEGGNLEDRLKSLSETTGNMETAVAAAATPVEVLRTTYRDLADEVQRAGGIMAGFAGEIAKRDAIGAAKALSGGLGVAFEMPETPTGWDGTVNADRARMAAEQRADAMETLKEKTGAAGEAADRLAMALRRTDSSNSLAAVVKDSENLLSVIDTLYATATDEQRKFLEAWSGQVGAVMDAAKRQIAAQTAEDARLVSEYDSNTAKMNRLTADRQAAEQRLTQAKKAGDAEQVTSMQRVIDGIDQQITKMKELARESDAAYQAIGENVRAAAAEYLAAGFEAVVGVNPAEYGRQATAANSGLLELIASKESGGDYNATLDNGRWTGGPRDLTNMSLNEILALGDSMRTPENRNLYRDKDGNPAGSSALGRYQIVGKTLRGLITTLGLTGEEAYDPAMQDRLATELIRQRRPQGVEGMRAEWAGLKNVPAHIITAAMGNTAVPREDAGVIAARERAAAESKRQADAKAREDQRTDDSFAASMARFRQNMEAMEMEGRAIGETAGEITRMRTELELTQEAKRRGIDLNSKLAGSEMTVAEAIAKQAEAAGKAADEVDKLAKSQEQSAQWQAEMASLSRDLNQGFVDAIVNGEDLGETMDRMAKKMQAALLESALFGTGPMGGMFGQGLQSWMSNGIGKILTGGFSKGGYTGAGAKNDPAGVVHKGEYVMSQRAVQALGVENLERLHESALKGYSGGGLVGDARQARKAVSASLGAAQRAPSVTIGGANITVNGGGGSPEQNADLAKKIAREHEAGMRGLIQSELVRQRRPGGMLR